MSQLVLGAAHAELKTALTQAIDEFGASASGYSNQQEVFRRIERFVAILLQVDGAEEELISRATRIANSCSQWSGYTQAVKRSIRARKSAPSYLAKAIKGLRSMSAATPKWRQEIERHEEDIELILKSRLELSGAGKSALEKWQAGCRDVLRKTVALDADGCWFLLQLYRAGDQNPSEDAIAAKAIVSGFGANWLTDVLKAADSLKEWVNNRPLTAPQPPAEAQSAIVETTAEAPTRKRKRSTEKGEARKKIIAALTKHHQYADGGVLNQEPIGNNELGRKADVDRATASAFFRKEFKGHDKYKVICRDARRLAFSLKQLNGEFAADVLYGARPPEQEYLDDE